MSDLFDIAGKTALVTGGSRGIGLMIARGFVEAGATVYISSRKAEVCDEVAAELSKLGTCVSLPADLVDRGRVQRPGRARSPAREAELHILVNNAGATWGAPLAEYPGRRVGQGARPQREGAVLPRPGRCCRCSKRRRPPTIPARVINIGSIDGDPGADARDLRVLVEQGRGPPADAPPRPAASGRATSP